MNARGEVKENAKHSVAARRNRANKEGIGKSMPSFYFYYKDLTRPCRGPSSTKDKRWSNI